MYNPQDPHQFFETYDNNDVLVCRWTMDQIDRKDGTVWVMNHFFFVPTEDSKKSMPRLLDDEMDTVLDIAKESGYPIWPLDPLIIDYFEKHPEFHKIWYHRPFKR